ncbi:hypothetical protein BDZ45DRAFT_776927 [Acephala macrosclerotiorum]|nr:hypothetical protein BDZ45DRAFT_776927 [Acephala macrosclerotiorum]
MPRLARRIKRATRRAAILNTPKLPLELRNLIWEFSLPDAQLLKFSRPRLGLEQENERMQCLREFIGSIARTLPKATTDNDEGSKPSEGICKVPCALLHVTIEREVDEPLGQGYARIHGHSSVYGLARNVIDYRDPDVRMTALWKELKAEDTAHVVSNAATNGHHPAGKYASTDQKLAPNDLPELEYLTSRISSSVFAPTQLNRTYGKD